MNLLHYFMPALILAGCSTNRQIRVHTLPNYQANAPHQILFLDFTINQPTAGKPEQVLLMNAIVGNGEMRPMNGSAHSPYQIKVVRHYTGDRPPESQLLEHPLFRSVEIADANGTLSRRATSTRSGPLSIRFPYTTSLTKLELYSLAPDQTEQKIYTLPIKP